MILRVLLMSVMAVVYITYLSGMFPEVGELCYININNDSPELLLEQRGDTLIFPILIRPPRFRAYGFDCDSNEIGFVSATWHAIEGYDYRIPSCGRLVANFCEFSDTSGVICVVEDPVGIQPDKVIPTQFALEQCLPNPFNNTTKIFFQLPKTTQATLTIYDIAGRKVKELVNNRTFTPGRHSVVWDGTDKNGRVVGTGIYLYEIRSELGRAVRKMLLVK